MLKYEKALLALLAATINHDISNCNEVLPLTEDEWGKLLKLAGGHGVTGLVFTAIEHLPQENMPPTNLVMDLVGQTEYNKAKYKKQFITAKKFSKALKEKGVEMKILKGISFSTYYDIPELRECGDCDCYLSLLGPTPDNIKETKSGSTGFEVGNNTIQEIGGKKETGSYKHSHLFLNGMLFENHHYITDFNGTKQGKRTEILLEEAIDSAPGTPILGSDMIRPCARFCALHCLRHAQGNLMLGGMMLRMLYDWAVILRAEQNNIDWKQFGEDLSIMHLENFASVMISICEKYLNLQITTKGAPRCEDEMLVDEVLLDTIRFNSSLNKKESMFEKSTRIWKRFKKMYHYRNLATESLPTMIWNSFAFSSYMKRDITLEN